ncbi:sensor histidine kinase [Solirhodobacter olei]|uniref:sensor histidine kinase n=1 Tax=Solirhodobacter olei TaxID=2493082 RepID=UPI001F4D5BD8|nr:sensor histidine kinase [Solirhodobacter olei]
MSPIPDPAPRALSLAARLAATLAAVLALGGLAVALAAFAYGRHAAQESYDRLLIGAANQIAGSITIRDGAPLVELPVAAFQLLSLAPQDRITYAVFGPDGAVITGYDSVRSPPKGETFYNGRFTGEPIRLVQVHRRFAERHFSGTVTVVVGQTTRSRAELAWQITRGALTAAGLAWLVICLLAVFAVRSSLRPLRRIERALGARAAQDLTPISVAVPAEIGSLVATLNRFIARLDRQVATMRTLIADTSHQLRTPIAALRVQAELAAEEQDPDRLRGILARIHDRAAGLGRLTDQLLNHALIIHRADAAALDRIDLRTVAIRAAEETDHDLFSTGAELELDLPEEAVPCLGDTLSLVEATKNLAGNALRYGRAPVRLFVRATPAGPEIGTADRGPGIPEAHWPDAATRYARKTGVSPKSAGLGLAIAAAVARAHGGTLAFARPAAGGFEAAILLPPPGGRR